VASRVTDIFGEGNANVIDGFCGVGGNLIQFAKKCGFCVGNGKLSIRLTSYILDYDQVKCEYALHNAKIYSADT
jgi:hypothetical protein